AAALTRRRNMEETINLKLGRRDFITAVMAAVFTGAVVQITGCSSSSDNSTGPGGSKDGLVETVNGHTHTVFITKDQLDAGLGVTLTLTGSSHTHDLILTDQQVKDIAAGTHTTKVSELGGSGPHQHPVHFN